MIRTGIHKQLDPAFRERLMLIVTQINDCPYCMHAHTRLARAAGVPAFEIQEIIEGQIPDDAPENELTALLYARDWAENNAHANETEINKLIEAYSQEKVDSINLALRLIWIGNLSGNSFDYFRYRLSFGRWGL